MEIPIYASGPDRKFSWKSYAVQSTRALAAWGSNRVGGESYNIRDNRDQPSRTQAPGAGLGTAARGAITGVLLGATLWGAILVLAGLIKI
jgi:hypothetical protein